MEPKPARIPQPCVVSALEIGQAITAIESAGRHLPDGPLKTSVINQLEQYLGNLQNDYSKTCLGTGPHKV
jgi:hypothetical protein